MNLETTIFISRYAHMPKNEELKSLFVFISMCYQWFCKCKTLKLFKYRNE